MQDSERNRYSSATTPRRNCEANHREHRTGDLATALEGADVFVGVSAPGVLKPEWIQQMNEQPVILQWLTQFLKFFLMKL